MRTAVLAAALTAALFFPTPTLAAEPEKKAETLENLERRKLLNEMDAVLDQMKRDMDTASKHRITDCLKVIGHTAFCTCIDQRIPFWAPFQAYVDTIIEGRDGLLKHLPDGVGEAEKDRAHILKMMQDARGGCIDAQHFN